MEIRTLHCKLNKTIVTRRSIVDEKPFRLFVNGRELVTLVASPHDPESLVVGFLYLQGIINGMADVRSLGVCRDSGMANVSICGEAPEKLMPVLTSGCGGGVMFGRDDATPEGLPDEAETPVYSPDYILQAMTDLSLAAEQYSQHGGIHSAALVDGSGILLHAEDLGRHNTVDRLAGMALGRGLGTAGLLLLTSGRISSEMAIKARRLGVATIATRTSPTELALRACEQYGIGLAGYVRGGSLDIYAHPGRFGYEGRVEDGTASA